jgi:hypothetical protein
MKNALTERMQIVACNSKHPMQKEINFLLIDILKLQIFCLQMGNRRLRQNPGIDFKSFVNNVFIEMDFYFLNFYIPEINFLCYR